MILKLQIFLSELGKTITSLIRIVLLSSWNIKIKINRRFDDCVILGNGPSLSSSLQNDVHILENKHLFCVNFFSTTADFIKVKPEFYIINAPEIWSDDLPENRQRTFSEIFTCLQQLTTWKLNLFLPAFAKKSDRYRNTINPLLSQNGKISVYFYNQTVIEGFKSITFWGFRSQLGTPRPHNVLIPGLVLSLNLGFKRIYLLGADHSWIKEITVDKNNQVLLTQKHFYDENRVKSRPMFNAEGGARKMHEVLLKLVYSFRGYFVIREYAEQLGATIINATPDSFIDAFDRADLSNQRT